MGQSTKSKPFLLQMIKVLVLAYLITALLLVVLAFLLYKLDLSVHVISLCVILIYVVSSFFGGLAAGKSVEKKRYLWGAALGFGYAGILTVISLVSAGGAAMDFPHILTAFAVCVGAGTIGGMLS